MRSRAADARAITRLCFVSQTRSRRVQTPNSKRRRVEKRVKIKEKKIKHREIPIATRPLGRFGLLRRRRDAFIRFERLVNVLLESTIDSLLSKRNDVFFG